jgi:hypothetical protein
MLLSGEAGDEEDHGLVSDELVDDPVPAVDDPRGSPVEAREQLPELARGRVLRDSGRAAHVHEQRAHLDLGASGVLVQTPEAKVQMRRLSGDGLFPKMRSTTLPGLPKGAKQSLQRGSAGRAFMMRFTLARPGIWPRSIRRQKSSCVW